MTQTATITKLIDSKNAEVVVERISACGENCAHCKGPCGERKVVKVEAENIISASVGDRVIVESKSSQIFLIAVLVYILPMVFLIAGYAAASVFGAAETAAIIVGIVCLLIGMLAIIPVNKVMKKKTSVSFVITAFAR